MNATMNTRPRTKTIYLSTEISGLLRDVARRLREGLGREPSDSEVIAYCVFHTVSPTRADAFVAGDGSRSHYARRSQR